MIILTIPTYNQCYYLCCNYIQGDKYVQTDVSVECDNYPCDPKYRRAEVCVCVCVCEEREKYLLLS